MRTTHGLLFLAAFGATCGTHIAGGQTKHGAADPRFLTYMIRHHEGALTMVKELFASPGAGQEPETFRFASDADTDQRAEIARMRAMLDALPSQPRSAKSPLFRGIGYDNSH